MISSEILKKYLKFNSETGLFTWIYLNKIRKNNNLAGTIIKQGYIRITLNKKAYFAHRLAWLYIHGEFPKGQIDHINGIRNDNRIDNLRIVTARQNNQNQKIHREGHLVGTSYDKTRNKWIAKIEINNKNINLGRFETQQEAHEAYLNKLKELKL